MMYKLKQMVINNTASAKFKTVMWTSTGAWKKETNKNKTTTRTKQKETEEEEHNRRHFSTLYWPQVKHILCLMVFPTFLVLCVLRQRVEKMPSVQSLVATSRRPNICGAVMALGFMRISLCGTPHSVMDFMRVWMQRVLPAPEGPSVIMPWRTFWVSYSWINFSTHGVWWIRPPSATWTVSSCTSLQAWEAGELLYH